MGQQHKMLTPLEATQGLPAWMVALRKVAQDELKPDDVKDLVRKQIDQAKAGDSKAATWVFQQLLGGNELKGATFIQNNYGAGAEPYKPNDGESSQPRIPAADVAPAGVRKIAAFLEAAGPSKLAAIARGIGVDVEAVSACLGDRRFKALPDGKFVLNS